MQKASLLCDKSFKLFFEIIKEKRVYNLMNVLQRSIMHSSGTPGGGIQSTLEYSAKDGGADLAPVKIIRGVSQEQVHDLIGEGRNFNIPIGEQAAVYIGESCQQGIVVSKVRIAILRFLIENAE